MSRPPRSLLFLSCDLVGSTKYKQSKNTIWHKTFLSFYRQFPQMLGDIANEESSALDFTLWKPIGDELIFTVQVNHESDVYDAVRIWLKTMRRYEDQVFRKVTNEPLVVDLTVEGAADEDGIDAQAAAEDTAIDKPAPDCAKETNRSEVSDQDDGEGVIALATKGGAFIATFPGPDSESSIPINPRSEVSDAGVVELNDMALEEPRDGHRFMFDYFGPSIDTGFRVLNACNQRYFTLSVEVAWAMAQCVADAGARATSFSISDMRLDGLREFKGVWDGREYPLFVIDRDIEDTVNVAVARIKKQELHAWDVVNLCRACQESEGWPSRLFLPESRHKDDFGTVPDDPLDEFRTYSTEGLENEPTETGGDEALEESAPLGRATPPRMAAAEDSSRPSSMPGAAKSKAPRTAPKPRATRKSATPES